MDVGRKANPSSRDITSIAAGSNRIGSGGQSVKRRFSIPAVRQNGTPTRDRLARAHPAVYAAIFAPEAGEDMTATKTMRVLRHFSPKNSVVGVVAFGRGQAYDDTFSFIGAPQNGNRRPPSLTDKPVLFGVRFPFRICRRHRVRPRSWSSLAARRRLMEVAVKNVKAFIAGSPINVVNR